MIEEEKNIASIELNVTSDSSPAFIWHTAQDVGVPLAGSLKLALAYKHAGVTIELHVYPYGPHGLALANELTALGNPDMIHPEAEGWLADSVEFIKGIG